MTTQPEALRLAEVSAYLEGGERGQWIVAAAAELRRLQAQRDALLEALRKIGRYTGDGPTYTTPWQDIVADLGQMARAVLAQPAPEPETCTWHQDGDSDSGVYATSCRHYFNLEDGTPEDNKMQWCCYCGKKLVQELIAENSDD